MESRYIPVSKLLDDYIFTVDEICRYFSLYKLIFYSSVGYRLIPIHRIPQELLRQCKINPLNIKFKFKNDGLIYPVDIGTNKDINNLFDYMIKQIYLHLKHFSKPTYKNTLRCFPFDLSEAIYFNLRDNDFINNIRSFIVLKKDIENFDAENECKKNNPNKKYIYEISKLKY